MKKALEPIAAVLAEGGLDEEEAFAVASALADLGVEEPAHLADVSEKYARQAADAAGLKPIRADKLVKIIKAPAPKHERAEEPSAVAAHLINDFDMNAKVHCSVLTHHIHTYRRTRTLCTGTHSHTTLFSLYLFYTHTHIYLSLTNMHALTHTDISFSISSLFLTHTLDTLT